MRTIAELSRERARRIPGVVEDEGRVGDVEFATPFISCESPAASGGAHLTWRALPREPRRVVPRAVAVSCLAASDSPHRVGARSPGVLGHADDHDATGSAGTASLQVQRPRAENATCPGTQYQPNMASWTCTSKKKRLYQPCIMPYNAATDLSA